MAAKVNAKEANANPHQLNPKWTQPVTLSYEDVVPKNLTPTDAAYYSSCYSWTYP